VKEAFLYICSSQVREQKGITWPRGSLLVRVGPEKTKKAIKNQDQEMDLVFAG
jgi:hypothetical protein